MIKIKLNGEEKEFPRGTTIQNILEQLDIKSSMIVVEKNLEIVPKESYSSHQISENDSLEIVGFFGGG